MRKSLKTRICWVIFLGLILVAVFSVNASADEADYDVDGNGVIDIDDAIIVFQWMDGAEIDIFDVLYIIESEEYKNTTDTTLSSSDTNFKIMVSDASVRPGDRFTVDVVTNEHGPVIIGGQINIGYDSNILTLVDGYGVGATGEWSLYGVNSYSDDQIRIILIDYIGISFPRQHVSQNFLARLVFEVASDAPLPSSSSIVILDSSPGLRNENYQGIPYSPVNGTVTIESDPPESDLIASPVFSPASGIYVAAQDVEISCPTEGAVIRYTADGTEPDENSPEYTKDTLPISVSADMTIKAKAYIEGLQIQSKTATAGYKISSAGNINGDDKVDLKDAILALQVVVEADDLPDLSREFEVNNDDKIGLAEAVYIVKALGEL